MRSRPLPSRTALALGALSFALLVSACAQIPTLSTQEALERQSIASTKLYAADGSLIANLHEEINRDIVPLDKIPQHVQRAVVAAEDERFWSHGGIDVPSIARALVSNVGSAAQSNGRLQGGSTLSQQLVKNLYFRNPERTVRRKLTEAQVTIQFERQYSKRKILEMYLNTIYLGRGVYGFQTAARSYFHKDVWDLSLSQAAYLAGIIRSPNSYDWTSVHADEAERRKRAATRRRDIVLDRMVELGFVSAEDAAKGKGEEPKIEDRPQEEWRYPYFVDMVLRQLGVLRTSTGAAQAPLDPRFEFLGATYEERSKNVYRGGLRIYTTVDPQAQNAAEEAVSRALPAQLDRLDAALVAIEPRTGYIRAVHGGRDYYPDCQATDASVRCRFAKVNLALGSAGGGSGRQPGSSFKPMVLATALQRGVSLRQSYDTSPFTVQIPGSAPWKVRNYEGDPGGSLDLVEGTVHSVNAVYAHLEVDGVGDGKALQGSARVADMARKLGVAFETPGQMQLRCGDKYGKRDNCIPADKVPAIALGAKEVSPLEMASAYATFANEGVHVRPTSVARITDSAGKVLWEADPAHARVLPRPIALGMTHVLTQVIERGTGVKARPGRPAAGKTGTAQEWRDAWFAGYVPQLTAVVWVGNPAGVLATRAPGGDWKPTRTLCPPELPASVAGATAYRCEPESMTPAQGYPFKIVGGTFPANIWQYFMSKALADVPVQHFAPAPAELFGAVAATPPPVAKVPDVLGMLRDAASAALKAGGFGVAERPCLAPKAAEGTVVMQTPPGGTEVPTGTAVTICVSTRTLPGPGGSPRPGFGGQQSGGRVPSVVGMSRAEAMNELSQAGYRGSFVRECDPTDQAASGRVWRQSPEGGVGAERGTLVTLWYEGAGC